MDELRRSDFGTDFVWGVATASYQIEGGWDLDGKSPSIWDTFTHGSSPRPLPPRIRDRSTGDVACDFVHHVTEDTQLVADLGFDASRFSISWPRVLPAGVGPPNEAGLAFYDRVVDEYLARGVDPWVTLYHWDLPQALQDRGGWTNRDIVSWFGDYCGLVADRLGDRVKHWMVFNEPLSFTLLGHLLGVHAPGIRSRRKFLASVHHTNLAQASGEAAIRAASSDAVVGTTQYFGPILGGGNEKARRATDALINRIFVEPNLGLGYPTDDCGFIRPIEAHLRPGDHEALKVHWDFMGAQYYTKFKQLPIPVPGLGAIPVFGRDHRNYEISATGWEVRPDGLYDVLKRCQDWGFERIIVTENGTAVPDVVEGDRVHDPRRVEFYRRHLDQVRRAIQDGIPVEGYFCWSLMDNFEWAEGYGPRFGITYVDYESQRRIVKDSGRFFQQFLHA